MLLGLYDVKTEPPLKSLLTFTDGVYSPVIVLLQEGHGSLRTPGSETFTAAYTPICSPEGIKIATPPVLQHTDNTQSCVHKKTSNSKHS